MNPLEIAKEIFGLAVNAGLKKDVVDLLEKKVGLLTEEITALKTENANLKAKLYDLEQELNRVKPKRDLEDDTIKVIRLFFDHDLTASQVANALGMSYGMADYHCGALYEKHMIALPMIRNLGAENSCWNTTKHSRPSKTLSVVRAHAWHARLPSFKFTFCFSRGIPDSSRFLSFVFRRAI